MRIAFPGNIKKRPGPWVESFGGAGTWVELVSHYLITHGHEVTYDWNDQYDVLIHFADLVPLEVIQSVRARGSKVLYRMDGLYWEYLWPDHTAALHNVGLKERVLNADQVVFQSKFVQNTVHHYLLDGVHHISGVVIPNGTDPEAFSPDGATLTRPSKRFVILCSNSGHPLLSNWIMQNLAVIMGSLGQTPVEFWILGDIFSESTKIMEETGAFWRELGIVQHDLMASYLRSADLLLHLRPNDPCPNLVIEAMHCGTPVIALNSGGLPELLGESDLLLDSDNSLECFPKLDLTHASTRIQKVLLEKERYHRRMVEQSGRFHWNSIGEQYLYQLEKLVRG